MDFISFKVIDFIDIALVALLLAQIYRVIRGTAALTIFLGVSILYTVYILVNLFNMELLSQILGQIIGVGAIALVIVFQQEVRRYLLLLGSRTANTNNKFLRRIIRSHGAKTTLDNLFLAELTAALQSMSQSYTGALIVIERSSDLRAYAESGDRVDAELSARLIEAIFFKNSPMHDGAMIIKHSRIQAARCILPTSDNPEISAQLGLRHRAAIGLSEQSDAIVIVVSEERGTISLVESGKITKIEKNDDLLKIVGEKISAS
ncbi:MAG: diadenylate cyclase CdaA [Rikenellaceae bacterium]